MVEYLKTKTLHVSICRNKETKKVGWNEKVSGNCSLRWAHINFTPLSFCSAKTGWFFHKKKKEKKTWSKRCDKNKMTDTKISAMYTFQRLPFKMYKKTSNKSCADNSESLKPNIIWNFTMQGHFDLWLKPTLLKSGQASN